MEKYIVVTAPSVEELEKQVNSEIFSGYKPIGGVCVVISPPYSPRNMQYSQALVDASLKT
jgi:hypothetical protein